MKVWQKRTIICIIIAGGISIVILCIINACKNNTFWTFNIFNGITMLWTVGISFLLTQVFSKQQKHIEIIAKVLQELIINIDESRTCNISTSDGTNQILLMQNRQINQQIALLKQYAKQFGFDKEIQFVSDEFNQYEKIISDHITDLDYLSKSRNELSRPIKLIREKLYEVLMKI